MTRNEFMNAKMFGGMEMLINGTWKKVSTIDFQTGVHEDSDGNAYPLDSITKYSEIQKIIDA